MTARQSIQDVENEVVSLNPHPKGQSRAGSSRIARPHPSRSSLPPDDVERGPVFGLTTFWKPQKSDKTPEVDILLIHGIGAHPDKSWFCHTDDGWYRDWLSSPNMLRKDLKVPIRVLRFGYGSEWYGERAEETKIKDQASRLLQLLKAKRTKDPLRPLVIIAHCYGGLLLLEAYRAAKYEPRWSNFHTALAGVAFFATPFGGSDKFDRSSKLVEVVRRQHKTVFEENLRDLQAGNNNSIDYAETFCKDQNNYPIDEKAIVRCFYEKQSSNLGRILEKNDGEFEDEIVFPEEICTMSRYLSENIPLKKNHFNINKFKGPKDEDFERVKIEVHEMIESAQKIVFQRLQTKRELAPKRSDYGNGSSIATMGRILLRAFTG